MNSTITCGLKGQYKVDIKDRNGNLVESTDWFDNDITNVGLNYPYWYSFARAFSFLSLGIGPALGVNRQRYSGLPFPSTGYYVFDPSVTGVPPNGYPTGTYIQSGTYIGWPGYELGQSKYNFSNANSSTCGTNFTNQGVSLYRGWTIPTGLAENPGSYLSQNLTINNFMVSPSSGLDPIGRYAFSLVDRSVVIPSGFSATITYQLSLSFPTYTAAYNLFQSYTGGYTGGTVPFNFTGFTGNYTGNPTGWFSLSNATSGTNGSETGLLALWGNLSGIFRQIYPGIELVNPLGGCSTPNAGSQLEPYITQCSNLNFYLSSDMTQFGVNKFAPGGPATGEYGAYNSLGLSSNYIEFINYTGASASYQTTDTTSFPSNPNLYYYSGLTNTFVPTPGSSLDPNTSSEVYVASYNTLFSNLHLNVLMPISNYDNGPLGEQDYRTTLFVSAAGYPIAYATPGSGQNPAFTNYGQKGLFSSYLKELPNSNTPNPLSNTGVGYLQTYRTNSCSKKAFFPPILSMGTNSRFGSLTLGFNQSPGAISQVTYSPYVDFIFFDTSGRIANMPHYRYFPHLQLANRGSGIAHVIFSITGFGGSRPGSIARLWQVTGFMSSGFNGTSGLDPNNWLVTGTIPDPTHVFIPPGDAVSGFTFPGQVIASGVNGGTGVANVLPYGWGAVYGIVASSGFYQSLIDCGLTDDPIWSGYTGTLSGIPDQTGTPLFWPIAASGMGVQVSGLQYFLKGFSELNSGVNFDTGNLYSSGVYAMVGDFGFTGAITTETGSVLDVIDSTMSYFNQGWNTSNPSSYPYQALYFTTSSSAPAIANLVSLGNILSLKNVAFTGISGNISFGLSTGIDNQNYYAVTGFNYNLGIVSGRGSGQLWTVAYANSLQLSGASNAGSPYIVGSGAGPVPLYLTFYDGYNGGTFYPVTGARNVITIASQLCAPVAYIKHHESITLTGLVSNFSTGNRLLPNYALPNAQGVNTYSPTMGGQFPGLSTENGMEVYLNFAWSG